MPGKVINMLTGVKTRELSLVRRGANNKRIALTKSEDQHMDFAKLLKSVLATEAEGEKELIVTLKAAGANDEAVEIAVANFRLQAGFRDKLSKEHFSQVAKAAGFEISKAGHEDKDKAEDEEEDPKKPGFFMNGKKMPTAKSHTTEIPAEIQKTLDDQKAELQAVKKESAESKAEVASLRKAGDLKDYISKCAKDFAHVPGMSSEERGAKLQKCYEVSESFGEEQEKEWATVSAALKGSDLLKAQGIASSSDGSSAMGKVEAIAKEIRKNAPSLTKEQAMAEAWAENPELYTEYLADNPAQTAR